MSERELLKESIQKHLQSHDDLVMLDDGYYYFWPGRPLGAYSSNELRLVADILDEMNADWDKEVNKACDL